MTFYFMRLHDDGHLSSIAPNRTFDSKTAAKKAAPDLLAGRRGGGKIVLVHVIEEAILTASVRYEEFTGSP